MNAKSIFATMLVAILSMATGVVGAQPKIKLQPNQTVYLYPEGQRSHRGLPEAQGPLEDNGYRGMEEIADNGNMKKTGDEARMDLYFPKKPNGQMVIVCPGGGYRITSTYNEGLYVAEWFLAHKITVCVVKYRLPDGHWRIPLQDVQNAFRYCRAHAAEWKVNQIGVMGFSAGGHLAASASTLFVDEVTRPDFSILIYPVISLRHNTHSGTCKQLLGPKEKWFDDRVPAFKWKENVDKYDELLTRYSLDKQVSPKTPSTFLALSSDDKTVPVDNSTRYYVELVKNKVPAEMHIWPEGGHGWGFTKQAYKPEGKTDRFAPWRDEFYRALEKWLEKQKDAAK